jgi:hypothetical protein
MKYKVVEKEHLTMVNLPARIRETKAYIQNYSEKMTRSELKKIAWDEAWFGFLGDRIFSVLISGLYNRFGQFPKLISVLKDWIDNGIEHYDFNLVCHLHIQLTDPYYRWLTGEYLPERLGAGLGSFNAEIIQPDFISYSTKELKANTFRRLLSNLLRSAVECGLLSGKEHRHFETPIVSTRFFGYLVYTLQEFNFPMSDLCDSPYIKSICGEPEKLKRLLLEGQYKGWWEFNWDMNMFTLTPQYENISLWNEVAE